MASQNQKQGIGLIIILFVIISFISNKDDKNKTPISSSTGKEATFSVPPASQPQATQETTTFSDASAHSKYVNTDRLNIRSSPNGKILGYLNRGDLITVYHEENKWAKISPPNTPSRWVAKKLLCDTPNCYTVKPTPLRALQSEKPASPRPTHNNDYSGYDCPCSSGRICIGPRGGRYCITSGGNKRYGV
ncbi:MAG: SH3 domain-containing protein [Gibbsiella quercinecans]|uniref:SH3 domain-containing protein n=1 Tax=Gibbsiella quercinecans TaxID=929813 RepID=UPI003F3C3ED8